jgi:hypothetical protein
MKWSNTMRDTSAPVTSASLSAVQRVSFTRRAKMASTYRPRGVVTMAASVRIAPRRPPAFGCFSSSWPVLLATTTPASLPGSRRGIISRDCCLARIPTISSQASRLTTRPRAISSIRRAISRGVDDPSPNSLSSSGWTSARPSRNVGRYRRVSGSP